MIRPRVLAPLFLLLLVACPRAAPPAENPTPVAGDCRSDRDCGANGFCDKSNDDDDVAAFDDELGVCVKADFCFCHDEPVSCRSVCEPARECDPRDENACEDADERCLSTDGVSACSLAPDVDHCELVFSPRVAIAGDSVSVGVLGFSAADDMVRAPGFFVVAACAAGVCQQRVDAGCGAAVLRVYAADFVGSHRVVVVDEAGLAVVGAAVRVTTVGVVTETSTDAFGVAVVAVDAGNGTTAIAVAAAGFEGHMVVNPPRDLLVMTRRENSAVTGALASITGERLHTRGDFNFGISGVALSTNLDRFSFEDLFGAQSEVLVEIEGLTATGGERVPLPAGATLGLGDVRFREQALVTTRTPDANDRLWVWNLTSSLPLSQVGGLLIATGLNDLVLDLLSLPSLYDHDVVDFAAPAARVVVAADDADGNGVADALPAVDFPAIVLEPDTLSRFSDSPVAGAPDRTRVFAIVVVAVPGAGLLPLGMQERSADDEESFVNFVPPHDGMEAFVVKTLVIAYDERPWARDAPFALRTGEAFAGAPVVAVVDDHVVVADAAGVDVVHVVAVTAGHRDHLWARGVVDDIDTVAVAGVSFAGADSVIVEGILLDGPGDRFRLANDGGLDDVVALTRVAAP